MISKSVFYFLLIIPAVVAANDVPTASPYVGQQQRSIKALSEKEIADLQEGKGMGLSKVAELNHFPGPAHVIELADKLNLSARQKADTQNAFNMMSNEAKRLGTAIIAKETELEKLFLQPSVDSKQAQRLISEIAQLQGELRFAHVSAHLKMVSVLSPQQIAMYDDLRGYHNPEQSQHHHHHH
jgi:Spy/CpxP family protein refolding chaperone